MNPELVSEERLGELWEALSNSPPSPMTPEGFDEAFKYVDEGFGCADFFAGARAALEELGVFCVLDVERSRCRDTNGARCPWWDHVWEGCRYTTCAFESKGAVLVRLKGDK